MSAKHLNVIYPNQYCLNIREYVKNKIWERDYCNPLLSAVEQVGKLTKKDLDEKWA